MCVCVVVVWVGGGEGGVPAWRDATQQLLDAKRDGMRSGN